jgi:hypothetical protein
MKFIDRNSKEWIVAVLWRDINMEKRGTRSKRHQEGTWAVYQGMDSERRHPVTVAVDGRVLVKANWQFQSVALLVGKIMGEMLVLEYSGRQVPSKLTVEFVKGSASRVLAMRSLIIMKPPEPIVRQKARKSVNAIVWTNLAEPVPICLWAKSRDESTGSIKKELNPYIVIIEREAHKAKIPEE